MSDPVLSTTADAIINGALRLIGETDANQNPDPNATNDALESLSFMVKAWQAQGLHLWTKTEGILFLDVGSPDYTLGPNGDECGNLDDFIDTDLTVAAVATDRNITVTSTTGMSGAEDQFSSDPSDSTQDWTVVNGTLQITGTDLELIGDASAGEATYTLTDLTIGTTYRLDVVGDPNTSTSVIYTVDDGSTLATDTLTVAGTANLEFTATQTSLTFTILNGSALASGTLTSSMVLLDETTGDFIGVELDESTRQWTKILEVVDSTNITLVDTITSAAAIGNTVFTFPELIDRPLRILQLRRFKVGNNDEIEANQWSRQEYFAQPDKTSQGTVNNWYYSPQLTDGRVYVWQTANDVNQVCKFTYIRPIEISEDTADSPDFPAEWFNALKWNLAAEIGPEYRIPQDRLAYIKGEAFRLLDEALGYDEEPADINIMPDFRFR